MVTEMVSLAGRLMVVELSYLGRWDGVANKTFVNYIYPFWVFRIIITYINNFVLYYY